MKISVVQGTAVPIFGNDIDTDRVVPARFLKEITFQNMGKYLFYDVRFDPEGNVLDFPLNDPKYANASVMVVGRNFGCGSSREHAAQAVLRAGFKAVIGESFSEIFSGNCKSVGIPAITLTAPEIASLQEKIAQNPGLKFDINLETKQLKVGDQALTFSMDEEMRNAFLGGTWDAVALLKENEALINDLAKRLPYMSW